MKQEIYGRPWLVSTHCFSAAKSVPWMRFSTLWQAGAEWPGRFGAAHAPSPDVRYVDQSA